MLCLISIANGSAQRLVPGPGAEAPDPGYVRLISSVVLAAAQKGCTDQCDSSEQCREARDHVAPTERCVLIDIVCVLWTIGVVVV